ncbi:MAG: DNA polymerase III subunit gamma/tau, partial [Firmicutes bacterium]|nr:DNA polymerase III subunit gamma/tau [Bacillota bacterium]
MTDKILNKNINSTALYRKYRPKSFDEIIGQDHIVKILTNQIKYGNFGHAYLFCGSRGTGKTSIAKIFAQALNCNYPDDAPCGKCKFCLSHNNSSDLDIIEIDAASNNGVDEIRIIKDNIQFLPSNGKYKIYIIDEVHMLSNNAFNALLKTLEEPPLHAKFILATTEVHKLPATILSRCMRFDFRLVSQIELSKHLSNIFVKENRQVEQMAIDYIATRAEGSVRDCLSIADSCLTNGNLDYNTVLSLLGSTDKRHSIEFLKSLHSGNFAYVLNSIQQLSLKGISWVQLSKEVCGVARDVLWIKVCGVSDFVDSQDSIKLLQEISQELSSQFLSSVMHNFASVETDLRQSSNPRIVFETTALIACTRQGLDIASLQERINRLEEFAKSNINLVTTTTIETKSIEQAKDKPLLSTVTKSEISNVVVNNKPLDALTVWGKIATWLRTNG